MEHKRKKQNTFSVTFTKNGRNLVIEVHDHAECVRPSVQKDIYFAVRRALIRLNELQIRAQELQALVDGEAA